MKIKSTLLFILPFVAAAGLKILLLANTAVPFNSDEAIVGLMARQILQGERPVFFYGQAYMGSLDAWLIAGVFWLVGESILAIRAVQIGLYLLYLLTLWVLARRIFEDRAVPTIAIWVAAVPIVLVTTYTTATLGGYGEVLVFGNLILWLGYEMIFGKWGRSWLAWVALGLVAGVAFWTLGLAGVYLLPVALVGLWHFRKEFFPGYVLALCGFLLGSSPWWGYNFIHDGAALAALIGTPGPHLVATTPVQRLTGFVLLGIPTLLGLRFPWSAELSPVSVLFISLLIYLGAVGYVLWGVWRSAPRMAAGRRQLLGVFVLGFYALFIGTHFGIDSTGRYFLPLYLPLTLAVATFVRAAWKRKSILGIGVLVLIIAVNGFETWRAAQSPDKITSQFDPITRFDNSHDAALMAFLHEKGEVRGYTNYWVSFRLAFLSHESLIFAASLPYKTDLSYTLADNRYPIYAERVAASPRVAYVTSKHPQLDKRIARKFDSLGVTFSETQIGDYHVFYQLSRPVRPEEIGFGVTIP